MNNFYIALALILFAVPSSAQDLLPTSIHGRAAVATYSAPAGPAADAGASEIGVDLGAGPMTLAIDVRTGLRAIYHHSAQPSSYRGAGEFSVRLYQSPIYSDLTDGLATVQALAGHFSLHAVDAGGAGVPYQDWLGVRAEINNDTFKLILSGRSTVSARNGYDRRLIESPAGYYQVTENGNYPALAISLDTSSRISPRLRLDGGLSWTMARGRTEAVITAHTPTGNRLDSYSASAPGDFWEGYVRLDSQIYGPYHIGIEGRVERRWEDSFALDFERRVAGIYVSAEW